MVTSAGPVTAIECITYLHVGTDIENMSHCMDLILDIDTDMDTEVDMDI